ncbi:MAG: hypothetical protein QM757_25645 [Paludibaculum sp.]
MIATVDAGAAEDRFDHLTVAEVGNDDAVFDGVAADDAAGRHAQREHRVARGRKLMDELAGGDAAIEDSGVALLQDDHAATLDARVGRLHRGGDEVGEPHVGDEAAALIDAKLRLFAFFPLFDADFAAEHAGFDSDVGNGLGQAERAAPGLAVLAGLRRGALAHVVILLLGRCRARGSGRGRGGWRGLPVAAPASTQASSKRDQGEREVLRPFDEAALREAP